MGPEGLREVNELSCAGAHYLYNQLIATGYFEPVFDKPCLKEFVLSLKPAYESLKPALQQHLADSGFLAAIDTPEGYLSFCVTERRSRTETDAIVAAVQEFMVKNA